MRTKFNAGADFNKIIPAKNSKTPEIIKTEKLGVKVKSRNAFIIYAGRKIGEKMCIFKANYITFCKIKLESGTDAHTRQRVAADEEVFKKHTVHLTAQATYKAAHGGLKALEAEIAVLRGILAMERSRLDQAIDFELPTITRRNDPARIKED